MHIKLIAVGEKMPAWVNEGFHEYQKRLKKGLVLHLVEIPMARRHKNSTTLSCLNHEANAILARLGKHDLPVILDSRGQQPDTRGVAGLLKKWQHQSPSVAMIIGGPDGLDERIRNIAAYTLSLSHLTMPHSLVRVVVAEQLYRAWSWLCGHPYHK